ncbi:TPA: hypothetical protein DGH83_05565 [Candidatus Peregrinibacteria bacterium]|nr:hypothetical protein [Candidatus Peregrinibacteria bacterium]
MKKTAKELHGQLKDFEENWKRELLNDEAYQKLRELKIQKEEEVAEEIAKLYQLVEKLPPKMWETKIETEEGQIRLQIQPEMKVYLNGKEEKRRA